MTPSVESLAAARKLLSLSQIELREYIFALALDGLAQSENAHNELGSLNDKTLEGLLADHS